MPTQKTFICVRNPLDSFPSYASLICTLSHGNKPEYDFALDYPEWWAWYVKKQASYMQRFFEILLRNCYNEAKQPLYIVRYEDLVQNTKETLMGLMSFILEKKNLSGTNVERRIDEIVSKGNAAAQTYRLKDTTGQFDVHKSKYSPELRAYIQETLGDQLYYFGYANVDDNSTGFFEFSEHTPENLAKNYKFRTDSLAALDIVTSEGYQPKTYVHNKGEMLPIFDEDDLANMLNPAFHYARQTIANAKTAVKIEE